MRHGRHFACALWALCLLWLSATFLAAQGLSIGRIGVIAALYPASWGLAQLGTGAWSDHVGRKPLIIAAYAGGAAALAVFVLAGSNVLGLWLGILLLATFNFVESPQLQALLSDVTPPALRDASFAIYFTLAFVSGSLWVLLYGAVVENLGNALGLSVSFVIMAVAFVVAASVVVPIRLDQGDASKLSAP